MYYAYNNQIPNVDTEIVKFVEEVTKIDITEAPKPHIFMGPREHLLKVSKTFEGHNPPHYDDKFVLDYTAE